MILLAATAALLAPVETARDYFPLIPGTRLVYQEKSLMASETVDIVGKEVEIAGLMTTQVKTQQNGKEINSTYYRITESAVDIVSYNQETPLPAPLPLIRLPEEGKDKISWSHSGAASSDAQAEPMSMQGTAQFKGEREFFGKKHRVLEVRIQAKVGGGKAGETITQTATYAKGIGLVELTSVTKVGRRDAKSELKLIRVEGPKEEG